MGSIAIAQFQQVRIGEISSKYKDSLSQKQLHDLIQEIKVQFERQLGYSVFEYSPSGLPINILFANESQRKKLLRRYKEDLTSTQNQIEQLDKHIADERGLFDKDTQTLKEVSDRLNRSIADLNSYIAKTNSTVSSLSKEQYQTLKQNIDAQQSNLKKEKKVFEQMRAGHNRDIREFNRMISRHNSLTRQYNSLVIRIESLSDSILEVKGKTIGKNITTVKTYTQDGKQIVQKENYSDMEKIEIYGFDGNMNQLKAVLAHEIGHLVGVNHIKNKGALMNPLLQSNQIEKMTLTPDDMKAFNQVFGAVRQK
ncbi:MAG: matrixin family metalloprotease [Thiovulaceae bacterium]|nr:matrixin family metalloprotease [Sulfurimonadaceae bacterium]